MRGVQSGGVRRYSRTAYQRDAEKKRNGGKKYKSSIATVEYPLSEQNVDPTTNKNYGGCSRIKSHESTGGDLGLTYRQCGTQSAIERC